jgi:hypothetical protein
MWGWGKRFLSLLNVQTGPWGPPVLLFVVHWDSFSELKRPGRDVDHSPPCGVEAKNEWNCTSTFFIRLHDADWYDLTIFTSVFYLAII